MDVCGKADFHSRPADRYNSFLSVLTDAFILTSSPADLCGAALRLRGAAVHRTERMSRSCFIFLKKQSA